MQGESMGTEKGTESRLERVSVDSPCPKRWSELVGDEKRRFCSSCALHVTNLSAMGRGEAEGFLAASAGRVCVTYVPDGNGGVATKRAPRARIARVLAQAASFLLGLVFLLPGCGPAAAQPGDVTAGGEPAPDDDGGRLLGSVRADPVCQVDGENMIMGEMVMPDPQMQEDCCQEDSGEEEPE
jgi:hypothetical protein